MGNKVLVVDDQGFMRKMLGAMLGKHGYEVVGETDNGTEALELCKSLSPDIITLDNILPDMIGLDLVQELKEHMDNLPRIIMISAVNKQEVIDEGVGLGVSKYLIKPFTEDQLVDALNS